MPKKIVLSAIQPTGLLHLGNYLGAVKNWLELQNNSNYQCLFFIADYHSLTTNKISTKERQEKTMVLTAELLALGLDPNKVIFFLQSQVPEHTELAWFFNCLTPISELERMTQFKDKARQQVKNINVGLLTYPVLQAADILLYNTDYVPVGADQIQHLELTNDIVKWFKKYYNFSLKKIKPLLTETSRVMSLLEPTKKMSKSLGDNHVINLSDKPELIIKKIKKAVSGVKADDPGVINLFNLLKDFAEPDLYNRFFEQQKQGEIKYGKLKEKLAEILVDYFTDFRNKKEELLKDKTYLQQILQQGGKQARQIARKNLKIIRQKIGLININY